MWATSDLFYLVLVSFYASDFRPHRRDNQEVGEARRRLGDR